MRRPELPSIRSLPAWQHPGLLEKAWALPVAKLYAPLLSQGITSLCGPTSAGNVLRSLGADAGRNPFARLGLRPMALEQLVEESAAIVPAPWSVRALRPASVEEFRAELRGLNDTGRRYIANFDRGPLFGHGGGHHSPLGGYLEEHDLVFVLDVNAGFGPWLVTPERLFESMDTVADWPQQ